MWTELGAWKDCRDIDADSIEMFRTTVRSGPDGPTLVREQFDGDWDNRWVNTDYSANGFYYFSYVESPVSIEDGTFGGGVGTGIRWYTPGSHHNAWYYVNRPAEGEFRFPERFHGAIPFDPEGDRTPVVYHSGEWDAFVRQCETRLMDGALQDVRDTRT